MTEVGNAFVSILPSFQGGAAKLASQVNPAVDKVGKDAGKRLSETLKSSLAIGAGAVVGAGVLTFLKDSISEAREAQKVGAITEQTIKSTGGAAKVTAGQIGDLATSISNKAGIDDEAIQSGANLLLTFTNIRNETGKGNDIFNQATQAITDLGVAMGTEPKAAAIQLGKALNDPIKGVSALTRAGVSFTAQQKDQIKTLVESGDILGAQKVILGELNKEFGGVAAASATAGDKAAVAFGNLKETIGTALLPLLDGVASVFTNVIAPAATLLVGAITSIPGPVLVTAAALGTLAALRGPLGSLFETIGIRALQFGDTFTGAGAGLRGFGAVAKEAGSGGLSVLKKGLGGVTSLLGGPLGVGLGVAAVGTAALVKAWTSASANADVFKAEVQSLSGALQQSGGAFDDNARAVVANALASDDLSDKYGSAYDAADKLSISTKQLTDAATGNRDAYKGVVAQLDAVIQQKAAFSNGTFTEAQTLDIDQAKFLKDALQQQSGAIADARQKAEQLARANGEGAAAQKAAGDAAEAAASQDQGAADAAQKHADAVGKLKDKLDILNGGFIAAQKALLGYADQLEQAQKAADGVTGASAAEQSALLDLATAGQAVISTMIDQGATQQDLVAKTVELRANFIAAAQQMGLTAAQAGVLADKMGLVPKDVSTQVSAPGVLPTTANIQTLIATANAIPPGKTVNVGVIDGPARDKLMALGYAVRVLPDGTVTVSADTGPAINKAQGAVTTINGLTARIRVTTAGVGSQIGGNNIAVASGGYISGPGTATSDSIPARLSNGEFVVRAAAVDTIGIQNLMRMNQTGRVQRFAAGGPVNASNNPSIHNHHVYIDGQELRAVARTEVAGELDRRGSRVLNGSRPR